MDPNSFPTKGNLILAKNSLALAKQGYELMDKKRNILIREIMELLGEVKSIQNEISDTFQKAYKALEIANIELGIDNVIEFAYSVPLETSVDIKIRSVMGTEIPLTSYEGDTSYPVYSFLSTREALDIAKKSFERVKELSIRLAMLENAAFRLAHNIKKSQKRANALQNITIPKYESLVFNITNALEEKEREEFTRLKVIKRNKTKKTK